MVSDRKPMKYSEGILSFYYCSSPAFDPLYSRGHKLVACRIRTLTKRMAMIRNWGVWRGVFVFSLSHVCQKCNFLIIKYYTSATEFVSRFHWKPIVSPSRGTGSQPAVSMPPLRTACVLEVKRQTRASQLICHPHSPTSDAIGSSSRPLFETRALSCKWN